jgi:hypothetical protein
MRTFAGGRRATGGAGVHPEIICQPRVEARSLQINLLVLTKNGEFVAAARDDG